MKKLVVPLWVALWGCGGTHEGSEPLCEFHTDLDGCPRNDIDDDCDGETDEDCVAPVANEAPDTTQTRCATDADCNDDLDCTDDVCALEGCRNLDFCGPLNAPPCEVTTTSDCDNDGVTPGAGDCDDTDRGVSAALEESSRAGNTDDGKDNDCDHTADEWGIGPDSDFDRVPDATDCDPVNPKRWTGAPELCNDGVDANCDGNDNTDDWGNCAEAVGVIDGAARDYTFERIVIAGQVSQGLMSTVTVDHILLVAVSSASNEWDASNDAWSTPWHGNDALHVVGDDNPFPRVAFVPRVRLTDESIIYFDLAKWRLTGNLRMVPGQTGRFTTMLDAP